MAMLEGLIMVIDNYQECREWCNQERNIFNRGTARLYMIGTLGR